MKKLRETQLSQEQLLVMVTHSQKRAARLCGLRAAGDRRHKLLVVITHACSAASMWQELYSEAERKASSSGFESPL
jgi:hypothetical protein